MDTQLQGHLQKLSWCRGPSVLPPRSCSARSVLIVLSIYVRGPLGTLCRVAVFIGAMAVIIGGTAILMNNVSLAGPPNPAVRLHRFLTMDWAATSDKATALRPAPTRLDSRPPAGGRRASRTPSSAAHGRGRTACCARRDSCGRCAGGAGGGPKRSRAFPNWCATRTPESRLRG